jgi:hypothetical protein
VNRVGVGGWLTREKGRVTLRIILSTRQGKVRILAAHMECTATATGVLCVERVQVGQPVWGKKCVLLLGACE